MPTRFISSKSFITPSLDILPHIQYQYTLVWTLSGGERNSDSSFELLTLDPEQDIANNAKTIIFKYLFMVHFIN